MEIERKFLVAEPPDLDDAERVEIELDVYAGDLDGLLTAEVEFPDEETAHEFEPPPWFGDEVTGNARYLNETLATERPPR